MEEGNGGEGDEAEDTELGETEKSFGSKNVLSLAVFPDQEWASRPQNWWSGGTVTVWEKKFKNSNKRIRVLN